MFDLFKAYDFYDTDQFFKTNLLSGEIGSGKTSFIMKYLYTLTIPKRDKKGNIDRSFVSPFKNVFINVDGFAFENFNDLAVKNGLDVQFKFLNMQHFKKFSYEERKLYTKFNSDGQGVIAKRVVEHIDDEYKPYINGLIVCDEADHWLTQKDDELANFLKFKRHYGMEIWLLTQKFQNLHNSFYLSGAVNRFLRIRTPMFNFGKSKYLQLWSNSDTSKTENIVAAYSFFIESEIYDLYDSGANLSNGNSVLKSSIMKPLIVLAFTIPLGIYFFYSLYSDHISDEDIQTSDLTQDLVTKVSDKKVTSLDNRKLKHIVKCTSFGDTSNCYFLSSFTSIPTKYIFKLKKSNMASVKTVFSYDDVTYIAVDDGTLHLLFNKISEKSKKD